MNSLSKVLLVCGVIVASLFGLILVDQWDLDRLRAYAYDQVLTDLAPDQISYSEVPGGRRTSSSIEYHPERFIDLSYPQFKEQVWTSTNKTIIHLDHSFLLQKQDDYRYYRYTLRIDVTRGFPLPEYRWSNPVNGEILVYGWVLIEGNYVTDWVPSFR